MNCNEDLAAWPISEAVRGGIPLSQAIATQRSFDNYLVLQEISTLLSDDMNAVKGYLLQWPLGA
jgi:hypothetical protein